MPRVTARTLALALAVALPAPLLAQSPAADVPETHTVKQGDTLWGISRQYFNDALQWPRLYQMNTAVVEDPHWIYPGEVLRLRTDVAVTSVPATDAPTQVAAAQPDQSMPAAQPEDSASRQAVAVAETVQDTTSTAPATDTTPIFPRPGTTITAPALSADFIDSYRAVTRGQFYQSGFMTEGKSWPLGTLLGIVAPSQVEAASTGSAYPYSQVAVDPPAAGAYQVGDTLLVVQVESGSYGSFGSPVLPLGLVRVTDASHPRLLGRVIAQYAQISPGSRVMMAEKFVDRPGVRARPLADGTEGTIIAFRSDDVLRGVGDIAFIDKGRADGMMMGDVLEAHRTIVPRNDVPVVVPDVVARMEVIHLGDKSATVRISWVSYPDIQTGTRWKLVARLPG